MLQPKQRKQKSQLKLKMLSMASVMWQCNSLLKKNKPETLLVD